MGQGLANTADVLRAGSMRGAGWVMDEEEIDCVMSSKK